MTRAVLEQHAEEAAALFALRLTTVHAAGTRLADLERLDARFDAHLDGLRLAGPRGVRIALRPLSQDGPGEVFVASVLAAASADRETVSRVVAGARPADVAIGVGAALSWLPSDVVETTLAYLAGSALSSARVAVIDACAAHRRQDPILDAALLDDDPALRAAALRAAGRLGRHERRAAVVAGMLSDEPACRFWSAWSGALLGERLAMPALRAIAESGGPFSGASAELFAIASRGAAAWVLDLASDGALGRPAIQAAAALGDPRLLPMLLDRLDDPSLARLAADAVARITGHSIEPELAGAAPAGHVAGPTDDPDDEDVAVDPDDDLPWPNAAAVRAAVERTTLALGVRHARGRPLDETSLRSLLAEGRQPERALAAVELARNGYPHFDVEARAHRQRAHLASAADPGGPPCGD